MSRRQSPSVAHALHTLQSTGRVALTGAPTAWAKTLRVLLWVLTVLLVLMVVVGIGSVPFAIAAGIEVTPATVFGALSVLAMIAGLLVWATWARRRQRATRQTEREDIVLDVHGLTLRGVGPIPWVDFGPAEHAMVPAQHDEGWTRRAVMWLTESGMYNVNNRLAPEQQRVLSYARRTIWGAEPYRFLYVPGARDLSTREVMDLINGARALMLGAPRG